MTSTIISTPGYMRDRQRDRQAKQRDRRYTRKRNDSQAIYSDLYIRPVDKRQRERRQAFALKYETDLEVGDDRRRDHECRHTGKTGQQVRDGGAGERVARLMDDG